MHDLQCVFEKSSDKFIKPSSFFVGAYRIKKTEIEEEEDEESVESEGTEESDEETKQEPKNDEVNLLNLEIEDAEQPAQESIPQELCLDHFLEVFEYDDEEFQNSWCEMQNE